MIVLLTVVVIVAVIGLIIVAKVDPVIALIAGSLSLGLAAGLGFEETLTTTVQGFGSIMADVGLLIGFGVLIGSLLFRMEALQRLVLLLLRVLGPARLPFAMAVALTTVFPSIYVDVQLVLAAPLARSTASRLGRNGLGLMAGSLTAGILVGYVFVVPGLATVSIAGLLDIQLATMLGYGLVIGTLTALITVFLYLLLVERGLWNPDKDEHASEALLAEEAFAVENDVSRAESRRRLPPLTAALLPVVVPLVLIASGAIADAAGSSNAAIAFLGNPNFALFVGLVGAYVLSRVTIGSDATDDAISKGLQTVGQILFITGIGGSLGEVIAATDLKDVLSSLFSAEAGAPLIVSIALAWLIAAVLHLAIGSISVASIAAAGIIGPVLRDLDAPVVIIGLAIGAGALFALQVNSNFFWMFQTLLGVSTSGALKALTLVTSLASVVALVLIAMLSLVF
jgi:H+/gluconate symporter-like permease